MDIERFSTLTEAEKLQIIWNGKLIAFRDDIFALLYLVNNFYVEVVYSPVENRIAAVTVFISSKLPEPYFDLISIAELK